MAVALLMQADLDCLEEGSLDHIARQMDDNGRLVGPRPRRSEGPQEVEDGIVESLDKIIKKMEDEQNQNNSQQSQSTPCSPTARRKTAPPWAARRRATLTNATSATRAAGATCRPSSAKRPCSRWASDFPPHYREAIEQYFRKLATEESNDEDK